LFCLSALKMFLDQEGIAYEEINVEDYPERFQEVYGKTGSTAVPQSIVEGKAIVGFDRPALEEALGIDDFLNGYSNAGSAEEPEICESCQ
jgi:glutaredoxin 3